jgi:transcriptional regulator with XRE-family HTH domain
MKDKAKDTVTAAAGEIRNLGDYIRDQRAGSGISLRQLAKTAGVSNPYLSQIERGLRKPSAEILQQIAKALRISAEALYVQAGFLEQRIGSGAVADAVLADEGLNERQKQVLLEIYESFRREDAALPDGGDVVVSVVTASTGAVDAVGAAEPATAAPTAAAQAAPRRAPARQPSASKPAASKPSTAKASSKQRPATAPDAGRATDPTA